MIQIKTRPTGSGGDDDAGTMLLACHDRIRRFVVMAHQLAEQPATTADVAETAAAIHRYFTVALPLHEADEDLTVLPQLQAHAPTLVALTAEALASQHEDIGVLVGRLAPVWGAAAREPERIESMRKVLAAGARRLTLMFEGHLESEERIIIPALPNLPPEVRRILVDEFRARRKLEPAQP